VDLFKHMVKSVQELTSHAHVTENKNAHQAKEQLTTLAVISKSYFTNRCDCNFKTGKNYLNWKSKWRTITIACGYFVLHNISKIKSESVQRRPRSYGHCSNECRPIVFFIRATLC